MTNPGRFAFRCLIATALASPTAPVFAGSCPYQVGATQQVSAPSMPTERCPLPLVQTNLLGSGQSFFLGNVAVTQSHCFDSATGRVSDGQFTLASAAGTIVGTYEGWLESAPTTATDGIAYLRNAHFEIIGGTGAAAGAEGSALGDAVFNLVTGTAKSMVIGRVKVPGFPCGN